MSEWQECVLGEYAKVLGGYAFKSGDFGDTGDFPVIKIKNVASGTLDMTSCQYISREVADTATRFKASRGDILIAMTGSHVHQPSSMVGKVTRYSSDDIAYINQRVGKIFSKNIDKLNEDFLYYFLKWDDTTYGLALSAGGSANQANISAGQIEGLQISLPCVEEQKAVVEVLLSIDAKIDLLKRQNKTLEELAQTYFRQWFVEYTNDEAIKYSLSELMTFQNGFAFRSKDYLDVGKYKIITIKNVQDGIIDTSGTAFLQHLPDGMPDNMLLATGDVLMSLTGNVGRVGIVTEDNLLLNQRVAKIKPINPEHLPFLYFYFRNETTKEYLINLAHGTAQANLSPIEALKTKISFNKSHVQRYSKFIRLMYQKIISNKQQVTTMQKLRDTLLPKLISGEVRVKQ